MVDFILNDKKDWDFPGGSVTKIPGFYCRGHGFDPWFAN